MLADGSVHFVATDAHGAQARRPLLSLAFDRVAAVAGSETATDLFCRNPARVVQGQDVPVRSKQSRRGRLLSSWFGWRRAG
jgi:protein-tyrosine phosphatase